MTPYVTITPLVGGAAPLRFLLGQTPAVPTTDGGWTVVTRPKNVGFTAWEGYSPTEMSLNVMIDNLRHGLSDPKRKPLDPDKLFSDLRLIMRNPVGSAKQPSPVRLSGPVPLTDLAWVINAVEQDPDSIIRNETTGKLERVSVTISLVQYIEPDVLVSITASPAATVNLKNFNAAVASASGKTYVVKDGDTLSSIAQKELGSFTRFTEIGDLNNLRDLKRVAVGSVLRLP